MPFEAECPQCRFVTKQLGQPTPCLLHVSFESAATAPNLSQDYDEPYALGQSRPTVDRTGPFTLREYVRLQLLRSRVEAHPSWLDMTAPQAQASLSS